MKLPKEGPPNNCVYSCDHTAPLHYVGVMYAMPENKSKPYVFWVCDRHVLDYLASPYFMVFHRSVWQELTKMPTLHDTPEDTYYVDFKPYYKEVL